MKIVPISDEPQPKKFGFDCGWQNLALELADGEFAAYSFCGIEAGNTAMLELICREETVIALKQDGVERARLTISPSRDVSRYSAVLVEAAKTTLTVSVEAGRVELHAITVE